MVERSVTFALTVKPFSSFGLIQIGLIRLRQPVQKGKEHSTKSYCLLVSDLSCTEADICHLYATCKFDEHMRREICVCDEGYHGDGTMCQKIGNPLPTQLTTSNTNYLANVWCILNHLFLV